MSESVKSAAPDASPTLDEVWAWLDDVPDPEIPVISVIDLGIIRDVRWEGDELVVVMTPTYSGCPALHVIRESIGEAIAAKGVKRYRVDTQLTPAWTTDWLTERGREQLRGYGIAPPARSDRNEQVIDISAILARKSQTSGVTCPQCNAGDTRVVSQFGSTPCKALYRCNHCGEPFDYFKTH